MTPAWGVETGNKEGFKDIVKAADDFAQRLVLERESTRTKSTREKGKEIPSRKKYRRSKARAREIPMPRVVTRFQRSTRSHGIIVLSSFTFTSVVPNHVREKRFHIPRSRTLSHLPATSTRGLRRNHTCNRSPCRQNYHFRMH